MTKRVKLNAEIAKMIKSIAQDRPELFQHEIAAMLSLNQGRVSEVLTGKRYAEVSV